MQENNRNSYGNILKATGLFGGVKIFEILISIIRSKFVAILLGPSGMGIYGLIQSPVNLIKSITGFGLSTSAVREVSRAYGEKDESRKDYIISVLRKLVWITGLLGVVVVFFAAKWLSQLSFGNTDYILWFRLVSVTLLIDQLVVGQKALMQGTFHYSFLAKSTLIGNVIGLFVTIPLYYWFGVKGVVPVFILHSLTTLALSWFFSHKIDYTRIKLSNKEILRGGSTMLRLGFAIAMTGCISLGTEYLLRVFISHDGNVSDVGLFNAGMAMATQYIGVVLTAMSTDYIPRLSASSGDNREFSEIINRQLQLLIVIIGPLASLFIVFIKPIVILLYSSQFLAITGMIEWIMFGMFFRSISFCFSYGIVSKAESKLFFWNEFFSCVYSLVFYGLGYHYYGFEGMGIAYCLIYVVYSIQTFLFCRIRYSVRFETKTRKNVIIQMAIVVMVLLLTKILHYSIYRYILGGVCIILVLAISYQQLNKMINVKNVLISIKNKLIKKK